MFEFLFNGISYGSEFIYDITWFVWVKRIALWTICGSVMYWIPGVSSLHSFLGKAVYGHLMYPYGLDAIYKLEIAPFIDLTGMGWPAVWAIIPSLVFYIYTGHLLGTMLWSYQLGTVYALDSSGVHWILRSDFNRVVDKLSHHQNANLDPSLFSTTDILRWNYLSIDKVILSDYSLYLDMLLA
jgi:hypothetical protein